MVITELSQPLPVPSFEVDVPDDNVEKGDEPRSEDSRPGIGRVPELAVGMAVGPLLVAVGFAASRSGHAWAVVPYWAGELVIFVVPTAFLLFRRSIQKVEALAIAFLVPVATYLVLIAYSPAEFKFTDEFSHVQTAETILTTHHLFHINTIVPVSPQYPGLEIATTALVSLTHLSITMAGMVIAGLAHLMAGVLIFFIVWELSANSRISALAAVIYATCPHYQFFDSYFSYETMGVPFLLFSVLAVVKMLKAQGTAATAWGGVAVVCGGITAISHHVTSYGLILLLLCFVVAQILMPGARWNWRLFFVIIAITTIIGYWDLVVATKTIGYFSPVVDALLGKGGSEGAVVVAHSSALKELANGHPATGTPPFRDAIMQYLSTLVLLVLTPIGAWGLWATRRTHANVAMLAMAVASGSVFLVVAIRLFLGSGGGGQLSGRAMTFAMIPASFACAVVLAGRFGDEGGGIRPRHQKTRSWKFGAIGVVSVAVLAVGGIVGGLPGFYARLPGAFVVGAWERSVDTHNLKAAEWTAANLPPNSGTASDLLTGQLMSGLGYQADVHNVASLFLNLRFQESDATVVRKHHLLFIVADTRITEQLPATGNYFTRDPFKGLYAHPLPAATIDKFDTIAGVSRIYDDGTIRIYDLEGSVYSK